jgi:prephenate dehydrogenase
MWRDIAMANPKAIVAALDDLQEELDGLRTALEVEDAEALEQFFDEGRRLRSDWLKGRE